MRFWVCYHHMKKTIIYSLTQALYPLTFFSKRIHLPFIPLHSKGMNLSPWALEDVCLESLSEYLLISERSLAIIISCNWCGLTKSTIGFPGTGSVEEKLDYIDTCKERDAENSCLCTSLWFQVILRLTTTRKLSNHKLNALAVLLELCEALWKMAKGLKLTLVFKILNQVRFFIISVFPSFTTPLAEDLIDKNY